VRRGPSCRPVRDVGILKLIGVEAIDSLDLRDYLVASSRDVEAINEVASHQPAQVSAYLSEVEPHRGHFVTVDHVFGLWLIYLYVYNRRKGKHMALSRLHLQLVGEFEDLRWLGRRCQDELDWKIAAAREAGGVTGKILMPGIF